MAREPKNANIDIRQKARVFDEQAFVDGMFNDDYILVVGSGVILDRQQFSNSRGDINQYIINEINKDRSKVQTDFKGHKSTDVYSSFGAIKKQPRSRLEYGYSMHRVCEPGEFYLHSRRIHGVLLEVT